MSDEQISPPTLNPWIRSVMQDIAIFLTLLAPVGALSIFLLNIAIIEPQQRLERRLEKLEVAHEQTRDRLGSIDKNLAVVAESSRQTNDALNAIRDYFKAHP